MEFLDTDYITTIDWESRIKSLHTSYKGYAFVKTTQLILHKL